MYIVIVGGGRVGYYLAKALLEEGHEVLIIEQNHIICETINHEMGSICHRGDGCEVSTLADAGTGRAAMFQRGNGRGGEVDYADFGGAVLRIHGFDPFSLVALLTIHKLHGRGGSLE